MRHPFIISFLFYFAFLINSKAQLNPQAIHWDSAKISSSDYRLLKSLQPQSFLLPPISQSPYEIELRFILSRQHKKSWDSNCIRIFQDDSQNWQAEQFLTFSTLEKHFHDPSQAHPEWKAFGEHKLGELLILGYVFSPSKGVVEFWESFWQEFKQDQYLDLQNEEEIHEQILLKAIEEFGQLDSIPPDHKSAIVALHGTNYRIEIKYSSRFKRLNYYAADLYASHFPEHQDFQKMLDLFQLLQDVFRFIDP